MLTRCAKAYSSSSSVV